MNKAMKAKLDAKAAILREEYGKIQRMDPEGELCTRLLAVLDTVDDKTIVYLAKADIPFVSPLARNRAARRNLKL